MWRLKMEALESKWFNSKLDIIGVNSLRFGGLTKLLKIIN